MFDVTARNITQILESCDSAGVSPVKQADEIN